MSSAKGSNAGLVSRCLGGFFPGQKEGTMRYLMEDELYLVGGGVNKGSDGGSSSHGGNACPDGQHYESGSYASISGGGKAGVKVPIEGIPIGGDVSARGSGSRNSWGGCVQDGYYRGRDGTIKRYVLPKYNGA